MSDSAGPDCPAGQSGDEQGGTDPLDLVSIAYPICSSLSNSLNLASGTSSRKKKARGITKRIAGYEEELTTSRINYLQYKRKLETAITELGDEDREVLVAAHGEDLAYSRVETTAGIDIKRDTGAPDSILGENLKTATIMLKELVLHVTQIYAALRASEDNAANAQAENTSTDELKAARISYLQGKRKLAKAIFELSEGEEEVLIQIYREDLTYCRVEAGEGI
ncbi:uncharacterized protein N7496_005366 [Penicillium cataractarum]|uniref:Uncharacterized protein n=1 Tax=Penicillium cataractarum TaxID=2100454 RepID=A0A9W9SH06_9EURO|nr:uncharacterized protein N7496_005366 [Penicillium cataractarum]KAJ5377957.1 hypothetical protein N7496_005366 [Penicillium cataractarum]